MIVRLRVFTDGAWGTLNTRECNERDEEAVARVLAELSALQSGWSSNYGRFIGAPFRIEREKGQ